MAAARSVKGKMENGFRAEITGCSMRHVVSDGFIQMGLVVIIDQLWACDFVCVSGCKV